MTCVDQSNPLPNHALVFGISDLALALQARRFLEAAGLGTTLDIGAQGWPATLWVDPDEPLDPATRRVAYDVVGAVDPASRLLPQSARRRESLRISAFRAS